MQPRLSLGPLPGRPSPSPFPSFLLCWWGPGELQACLLVLPGASPWEAWACNEDRCLRGEPESPVLVLPGFFTDILGSRGFWFHLAGTCFLVLKALGMPCDSGPEGHIATGSQDTLRMAGRLTSCVVLLCPVGSFS